MAGEVRNVKVRLSVENAQAIAGVKQFGSATEQVASQVQRAGVNHAKAWASIGRGSRNVAIGGAIALGVIEKASYTFDKQMSGVDAATHETARNMGLLREAAIKAGADTQFSATEAAAGVTELAKAGVKTKDVLGGGLAGALDLAAAGQISVAEAAETAASAMTQFELSGKNVPHIADLLAAGAGKAQGSVHDLGMALNQSGLVASQTGLTIEDTTGTLAAFAKAGLLGSDAGTSFKTMLLSLNPRSDEAGKLMKRYNIEAYDAQGNFIGITKYAGKLRDGLKGLTDQQRAAALQTIFGTDAIRAANILYRQGGKGIEGWIRKVNEQGYAADTAARQTDNLAGDVERFTGSLESAFIKAGTGAQGGLRDTVQLAEKAVDAFAGLPDAVQSGVVKVIALTTATAGALYVASKLRKAYMGAQALFGVTKATTVASTAGGLVGSLKPVPVYIVNGPGGLPSTTKPGVPPVVAIKGGGLLATLGKTGAYAAAAYGIFKLGDETLNLVDSFKRGSEAGEKLTGSQKSLRDELGRSNVGKYAKDLHIDLDKLAVDMQKNGDKGKYFTKVMRDLKVKGFGEQANRLGGFLYPFGSNDTNKGLDAGFDLEKIGTKATKILDASRGELKASIGRYTHEYSLLPAGVQKAFAEGSAQSKAGIARLAKQFNLTPIQVKALVTLAGGEQAMAAAHRLAVRMAHELDMTRGPKKNVVEPTKGDVGGLLLKPSGVKAPDLSKYANQLKNIPAAVITKIQTLGAVTSAAQVRALGRQYDLTPKQVRTLMKVLGIPKAHGDLRGVDAAMKNTDKKRANPKVSVDTGSAFAGIGRIRSALNNIPDEEVRVRVTRSQVGAGSGGGGSLTPADGATVPGSRFPYRDSVHAIVAPTEEIISNRYGQADRHRPLLKAINANRFAAGGTVGAVTGGRVGDSVTVTFPAPAIYKAAVTAAEQIAGDAAKTARSAKDIRDTNLEDLHTQQRIRDLTLELAKTEKVRVKGKDGKDDNTKKKGIQDTLKTTTRLAVRGLDRTTAQAELAATKAELGEVRNAAKVAADEARREAVLALREARTSATETLTGTGSIFDRGPSPMAAIRSSDKQAADIAKFGNVMARLKSAKASPALLAQVLAKGQGGDFRSAIRLGEALLAQPALLGRLNASLGTLGQVSANVANLTTDPRFMATGAWNPAGQVAKSIQIEINLNADPSTWTPDITRVLMHRITTELGAA